MFMKLFVSFFGKLFLHVGFLFLKRIFCCNIKPIVVCFCGYVVKLMACDQEGLGFDPRLIENFFLLHSLRIKSLVITVTSSYSSLYS